VSELVDRRIAHPKEVVREGDLLPLKIVRIERDRHRLGLSLRDARDEGLRLGFRFSDAGEVIEVPEDLRAEFEEREGIAVRTARDASADGDSSSGPPADAFSTPQTEAETGTDSEAAADEPSMEAPEEEPAADAPPAEETDTGQEDEAAE
jgi:hypothetical protein